MKSVRRTFTERRGLCDRKSRGIPAALRMLMIAVGVLSVCPQVRAKEISDAGRSIAETSLQWPAMQDVLRLISLQDYNTRVVVIGTTLLGAAAACIGTFLLLRRRALMGDALSHATLPGAAGAFLVMTALGGDGKWLPGLLAGAAVTGVFGLLCVLGILRFSRIKEDAALGIVLSVFFGLGISLLGVIQKMDTGSAAGLESFIYGKTASMLSSDAELIAWCAGAVALVCFILFKEFSVLCFDADFAQAQGYRGLVLDLIMLGLVVLVTVIGLQAVGLILIIALLVIPPAAARFWTDHLPTMCLAASAIGALSGLLGVGVSALMPRLPAGAIIVLSAALAFGVSFIFGSTRGVLIRAAERIRLTDTVGRQHLLRAFYERAETATAGVRAATYASMRARKERESITAAAVATPFDQILSARSWSPRALRRHVRRAIRAGLIRESAPDAKAYLLTPSGWQEAERVTRNHRLWELYLITHADIAPSHVDRDADQLEHLLGETMVRRLEELLEAEATRVAMPASPHRLFPGANA